MFSLFIMMILGAKTDRDRDRGRDIWLWRMTSISSFLLRLHLQMNILHFFSISFFVVLSSCVVIGRNTTFLLLPLSSLLFFSLLLHLHPQPIILFVVVSQSFFRFILSCLFVMCQAANSNESCVFTTDVLIIPLHGFVIKLNFNNNEDVYQMPWSPLWICTLFMQRLCFWL